MAKFLGRKVRIKIDNTTICSARTKSFSASGEPVDITTDCDDGVRKLLDELGQKQYSISVEGIFDDEAEGILDTFLGIGQSVTVELEFPSFTLSGSFVITAIEASLSYNEPAGFSATLESNGDMSKSGS